MLTRILLLLLICNAAAAQAVFDSLRTEVSRLKARNPSRTRDSLLYETYYALGEFYKQTHDWKPFRPDSALYFYDKALSVAVNESQKAYGLLSKGDTYTVGYWGAENAWIATDFFVQSIRTFSRIKEREGIHRAANGLYGAFGRRARGDRIFTENQLHVFVLAMEAQTGRNFTFPVNFQCDTALVPAQKAVYQKAIRACRENLETWISRQNQPLVMWRTETLGYLLYESGIDKNAGVEYLNSALKIARELSNMEIIFSITGHLAIWEYENKNYRNTVNLARAGFETGKEAGWARKESIFGDILYRAYKGMGMRDSAYYFKDRSITIMDSLSFLDARMQINHLLEKQKAEKQQADLEKQLQDQARFRNYTVIIGAILALATTYILFTNRRLARKNKEIYNALLEGQTTERKRVASDLHDSLGSTLTSLRWSFEAIDKTKLDTKEQDIYRHLQSSLDAAYDQVRLLSHNLLPQELEKQGLQEALRHLFNKLNNVSRINFSLHFQDDLPRLSSKMAFEIYSICLELVNNVLKHAQAQNVSVVFEKSGSSLSLSIIDDGSGMPENSLPGKGLRSIEERVHELKGTWETTANQPAGTAHQFSFPM